MALHPLILERQAHASLEALPHFIKVTVFKGCCFVTVLENTSFEQALSAPAKGNKGDRASSSSALEA